MNMMDAFFQKFKDEEAEKQAELKVEKPKGPEIVVITYEILDFLRMKGRNEDISVDPDFITAIGNPDAYHALYKEIRRVWKDSGTAKEWKNKVKGVMRDITAMTHECPAPEVALYSPLMFLTENGIRDYEPDEKHERTLVQDCLSYLRNRIAQDIDEGIIVPAEMNEMLIFSGLHGRSGPVRIADSLAMDFDIADKMAIVSTGFVDTKGIVKRVDGGRNKIEETINAYLKSPYFECRNRFEQGLGGLHEIVR